MRADPPERTGLNDIDEVNDIVKAEVGGLVEISTVDWYGHVTYMVFFAGCNFRCPFCQNAGMVTFGSGKEVDLGYIKSRIEESISLLDAVGATGGEPTLQPKALTELFSWAKKKGLEAFLNTNASRPSIVKNLLEKKLVSHVATDVKGPLSKPERLGRIIGLPGGAALKMARNIRETVRICLGEKVPLEIRTTIIPTLVDDESTVRAICKEIVEMGGCTVYYLQQFVPTEAVPDKSLRNVTPPSREVLMNLGRIALDEGIKNVYVKTRERGLERVQRC